MPTGVYQRVNLKERFDSKWMPEPFSGCWIWTAATNRQGYGLFHVGTKHTAAARVSWELYNGEIPLGKYVCHKCDIPICVNPNHLFIGTQTDNMRDMSAKGRYSTPSAKLSEQDVIAIRSDDRLQRIIAEAYGVQQPAISRIKAAKRWRNLSA